MSFIADPIRGTTFEAGFFLVDDEQCLRLTKMVAADHAQLVTRNGRKIVPAGAVIPANGSTAEGILYEDIDVTEGAAPGSVVVEGTVYGDRLPAALDSDAAAAMTKIRVLTSPAVVRPDYFDKAFSPLSVTSEAGTAAGDTALTVTGVTLGTGESYAYKVGDSAESPTLGSKPSGYTAWDGDDDVTAATGKKVTVVALTVGGYVFGAGSATVTAKA